LDTLIGIKIAGDNEELLRSIAYERRFRLIQNVGRIESLISEKILKAQNQMTRRKNEAMKNVDVRLRYVLLEESNFLLRKRLEKLFGTSLSQLRADWDRQKERLRVWEGNNRITNFRNTHQQKIEILKGELTKLLDEMHQSELEYRAWLFKDLKEKYKKWNGVRFVREYKKVYPQDSMSSPMVSRIEKPTRSDFKTHYKTPLNQRKKDLDVEKAKRVAHVFGIDNGVFLPAVVSSTYD